MDLKIAMLAVGAALTLAACALPAEHILTQAQADCRGGDRTACRQVPYLIEQVRIAQQDREARTQAALMAVSVGAFAASAAAASRPVYVVQPAPVYTAPAPVYVPHTTNCTTSYVGTFAYTNCN